METQIGSVASKVDTNQAEMKAMQHKTDAYQAKMDANQA
jgi:outer membrane murein-binding lipoprotein Lpp